MKKRVMLILSCLFLSIGLIVAQTKSISGTVIDGAGESVIGASVVVKGTTIGVSTDIDGRFTINMPTDKNILVFSLIGMTTVEKTASQGMEVVMSEDAKNLQEVIVTGGYGVRKQGSFTGAAAQINQANITNKNDVNAIKALDGSVPGIQMSVSSGQPGAPADIYIRGRGSINSGTQPLYVIDGMPINSDVDNLRKDEGIKTSPLSTISSSDIETITILKDASATSIYGSRAANGVILITTKKGQRGKTSVKFTAKLGFENATTNSRYKIVQGKKANELTSEALMNDYLTNGNNSRFTEYNNKLGLGLSPTNEGMLDLVQGIINDKGHAVSDMSKTTDWFDAITRTGSYQEYGVEVQGGGKDISDPRYFFSYNYLENESFVKGKDMLRHTLRFNFDQSPTKFIKYGLNTSLAYTKANAGNGGGYYKDPITAAMNGASPYEVIKTDNGEFNTNMIAGGNNPVALRSKNGDKDISKQYKVIINPYAQLTLLEKVVAMTKFGFDYYNINDFSYSSMFSSDGAKKNGYGENGNTYRNTLTSTNTINYFDTFEDKHNVSILIGQEAQETKYKQEYLAGSNYPVGSITDIGIASTPIGASTERDEMLLVSFFSNIEYDYNSKYYLSTSFRYDGSSKFSKDNRWAAFWSVGGKYRITEEDFMKSTQTWLNNLTLRASYGTTGNQDVGKPNDDINKKWYASRGLYGFNGFNDPFTYNKQPGARLVQLKNDKLKWETKDKFNFGLDFTVLDIFTFEGNYYVEQTKDMLFSMPISFVTGLATAYENIGKMENKGFELSLTTQILKNKDWNWSATISASKNKNVVKKLSNDEPIKTTYDIIEKGKPLTQWYLKKWAGVDPQTGAPLWYKGTEGNEVTSEYNEAGQRYLGKGTPDWIGSFSTTVNYKGIDFSIQFNYQLGSKIYGNNLRYDEHIGGGDDWLTGYTSWVYDNRWKQPGDNAKVPRLMAGNTSKANAHSSRFLMDGDYLKIRSLAIGYTFPKSLISKAYIQNARVFMNAENLYTFSRSDYRGFDPSTVNSSGMSWWNFPSSRSFVFGVTLGF